MKIALLTTDNREHQKDYGCPKPYFGTAPEALLSGFSRNPEVEIHVISCHQQPMMSPERLAPNIFYHGLTVPKIGWMRTGYQGCIRAVRRCLRQISPDIVHGQGTERDCAISSVFSGHPNVLTIHGNMAEIARIHEAKPWEYGWIAARLEDFTLPRTTGVFCNSEYTKALVAARGTQTWLVPNALRDPFFKELKHNPSARPPVLLNIGVVSPRKRQVELLDWAAELHAQGHRFELRFIGKADSNDSYGAAFADRIRIASAKGYAQHLPHLGLDALIEQLDMASALVHFPTEEAFGLVVAEALARNLKLFGARLGGIIDITASVELAELVDGNDWQGLSAAVAAWLNSDCPKPTTAAAEIKQRYHPDRVAARHVEIYREVLSTLS